MYINLIKLWYEVILRGLTIPLIKWFDAFPACHSDRLMTLLPLLMLIGPAHTHVSSPSQGHAVLVKSKIKSEHDVQPWRVTEITCRATSNTNVCIFRPHLSTHEFIFVPFYRILPFLYNTEKKTAAWPWKLLSWLTPRWWPFICWHLIYDIFVRATVECNYGLFHCMGPPQIACYFSREAILQKILTVGQWAPAFVLGR